MLDRRAPPWWSEAGESGTKLLYQLEPDPEIYIVPISSILGRLPLVPCCYDSYEEQQEPALQIWRVRQGRAPREWQQALLHQPVGHVLAL